MGERNGKRLVMLAVRVPRTDFEEITELSRRLGRTRSELVRRGIRWVKQHPEELEEVIHVGGAPGG